MATNVYMAVFLKKGHEIQYGIVAENTRLKKIDTQSIKKTGRHL